jgi:hypothetical protein
VSPLAPRLSVVGALFLASVSVGCSATAPRLVATPRAAIPVNASFSRTWDAAVEIVAERSRTIQMVDEGSGLIIVADVFVGDTSAPWADCGSTVAGAVTPTHFGYNVVVRGDSTSAEVRINAFWTSNVSRPTTECVSRGVWESAIQKLIKTRAESTK